MRAAHGQVAPNTNGGTLDPVAFINPTTVNATGRVAFNSQVNGSDRNAGCVRSQTQAAPSLQLLLAVAYRVEVETPLQCAVTIHPLADISAASFSGPFFTPDINDAGDVLFFCDVNGGSSRRALFLYRGATGEIVKVAAIGDPSPLGGTFGAVGPGSINNNGKIVFLASADRHP